MEFKKRNMRIASLDEELKSERERYGRLELACGKLGSDLGREKARAEKFASMLSGLKSEKLKIEDIDLENTVVIAAGEAAAPREVSCVPEKGKRPRGAVLGHVGNGREIPSDLPVIEVVLEASTSDPMCKKCGLPANDKPLMDSVACQISVEKRYILKKLIRKAYGTACGCDEQSTIKLEILARLAGNSGTSGITDVKYSDVPAKQITITLANSRRINIVAAGLVK